MDDQIKEDRMGKACGKHGSEEKGIQGFGGKIYRERYQHQDLGVDGKIILKWMCKGRGWENLFCINS